MDLLTLTTNDNLRMKKIRQITVVSSLFLYKKAQEKYVIQSNSWKEFVFNHLNIVESHFTSLGLSLCVVSKLGKKGWGLARGIQLTEQTGRGTTST